METFENERIESIPEFWKYSKCLPQSSTMETQYTRNFIDLGPTVSPTFKRNYKPSSMPTVGIMADSKIDSFITPSQWMIKNTQSKRGTIDRGINTSIKGNHMLR